MTTDSKKKDPLPLRILMLMAILFLGFSIYWQTNFHTTYSLDKTATKTKEVTSHGHSYYVDPAEYRKAMIIQWGGYGLFLLAFAIIARYKYKNDPTYFYFFKNQKK